MAFQQGLSGLYAASRALDVTSNNVANAATVGFKSASAHFADVFASSIGGSGSSQVGIGTTVNAVQQQFTQGNVTATNNPLDISINGGGFFRMSNNGTVTYSRNGQFHLDRNGFVIDDLSRQLTGYGVDPTTGDILTANAAPLQLNPAPIDPRATGPASDPSAGVTANLNFDSRAEVPAVAFDKDTPASYNFSTATTIYDSLGIAHSFTLYAVKAATVGDWNVYASVDNTDVANSGAGFPIALNFGTDGRLTGTGTGTATVDLDAVMAVVTPGTPNGAAPLDFIVNFSGSTQFGTAFGTNNVQQTGYTSGRLTGVSVGSDGTIKGNYSNGQSRTLGQVVLCNFTNPNGLVSLGGNQWAETSESGTAQLGVPNSGTLGVLQSSAVEESNVDLTAELVNMITEQRNYQANAQSIKTQDQIMQTLVNLR